MLKNNFLEFKPIQKFINGIGVEIKKYFGKNKGAIIGIEDDGIFYGLGLWQWLGQKQKNISFTTMGDDGNGLEEEKIKGRKVLLVDNDIISGKSYKKAIEIIKNRKKRLKIKEIKFAVLCDRTNLADFSVENYSAYGSWGLEKLDGVDLKIIQALFEDGRTPFVEIAQKTSLGPVGIKNRVEKLIDDGILKIQGLLNIEKVCSVSAHIGIETDNKTISRLIERFKKSPLVYHLAKASGRYNLIISIAAPDLKAIENFISKEIRRDFRIKHIEVNIGDLPIIPRVWLPPLS